jgi:hypothetical protein
MGRVISRRAFIATIVGVCILSSAVGSGITMLAKTGPEGPRGDRGPRGAEGQAAFTEARAVRYLETGMDEVTGWVEDAAELETRVGDMELAMFRAESSLAEVCIELSLRC